MKRLLVLVLLVGCSKTPKEDAPAAADIGSAPSVQDVCLALKRTDVFCVQHYVTMQKTDATKYACAARCIARDKDEAACASSCGTSPAAAAPADPMAIPQ